MKSYGKGKKTELVNNNTEARKSISGSATGTTGGKNLYQQLRDSDEKYRNLFELTPIGITILNPKGVIQSCNNAVYKMGGYSEEELVGKHFSQIATLRTKDIPKFMKIFDSVISGKVTSPFEVEYIRKDRTKGWTEIQAALIKSNGRITGIQIVQRDITEHKKAIQAQMESQQRYIALFENLNDAAFLADVKTGRIVDTNKKGEELLGRPREEIIGIHQTELHPPELTDEYRQRFAEHVKKGHAADYEGKIITASGTIVPVRISASTISINGEKLILSLFSDITERLKAEAKLKEEATRRHILVDGSRDGIVVLDQDGNVYESNQKFAEMLGYTSEEVNQLQVFDWEFQFTREEVLKMLRAGDDAGGCFETKHRCKDGTIYDVEISTNSATFAGQTLIFCVCRDITERKHAEEALRESEEFRSKLLNLSPNPIFVINPDTSVIYVNPAFEELTGFTSEELIGIKTPYPWWREESLEDIKKIISESIKEGSGPKEVLNKKKTGEYFWVETSHTPIMLDGELQYGLVTWNNINERKQAELALKESEDIRLKILDVSPNPIMVINPDGTNMYVNPAFEKLTGFSAEEVIGTKPPNPWWRESVIEEALRQVKKDLRIKKKDQEVLFKKKNGGKFWVASSSTPVRKNGKLQFTLITWNDITERKRAEEEVKLRAMLLDSAGDGINVTDLDGKFVYVNDVFCKSHGYNRDELMEMNIRQLVPQIDGEPVEKRVEEIITEQEMEFETLHVHKDNSQMMMEVHSRLIGSGGRQFILNVERDISERHEKEEEIKKLSAAIEYSPNIVMITDRDASIEYVNDKYIELTGYSADEIIGKNMREIDLRSLKEQRKMWRALTRGEDWHYEYLNRKKDGELYYEATSISAIKDRNDEITHFVRVGTDITEKKRTEGELQRSEQQLRELSNHMRQIREEERKSIARNIHDNLGQSLTALKIDMSWLIKRLTAEQLPLIEKANEMAAMIDQNIQTVKKLSSELRPEVLDILGLAAAIEWYADEFSQRTGIKCLLSLGEETITLEEEYFVDCYRILQESLINVSRHAKATRVRIDLKQEPDKLIMLIKDNGKGIAKKDRDETRSFGLMGMRERANSIGGKLEIKSTPGKGTTVKLTVPTKKQGE